MSTDNNKKGNANEGDWDTALEEWDHSPLVPALADDKTPLPAPGVPRAAETPPAGGTDEVRSTTPTVRPPEGISISDSDDDDDDDEERTVVGEIPAELLADSIRGLGSASGLGQIFGRESQPTIPADDEDDAPPLGALNFDDDGGVVTSAPAFSTTPAEQVRITPPRPSKPEIVAEVPDGHMFDPCADIHVGDAVSPAPGAVSSAAAPEQTDAPDGERSDGPKLLEPKDRQFSQDEETAVFDGRLGQSQPPPSFPGDDLEPISAPSAEATKPPEPRHARSVPPAAPTSAEPQWRDERDASAHLLDAGLRSSWEMRAAWLAEEAAARQNPDERSRIMLGVSELCAMLGDDEKAMAVAGAAREMAPANAILQRQARYAAVRDRAWFDVLASLETEARAAPTPEAKAHAALMQALLIERVQNDEDASGKQLDLAARVLPSDPRAHLARFVHGLNGADAASVTYRWSDADELEPLRGGADLLLRIRRAADAPAGDDDEIGPYEAIPRAKAALRARDTRAGSRALRALEPIRGMGVGATWLSASLAGQHAASREHSREWFADLANGPHAAVAQRLLVLRAVESNDAKAVAEGLAAPGSSAFSPSDRVVLGALFNVDSSMDFISRVLDHDATAPLGAAARAALTPIDQVHADERLESAAIGGDVHRATLALARQTVVGGQDDVYATRVTAFCGAEPESWVGKLLDVECAMAAGQRERLIDHLATWGGRVTEGAAERDRGLAAGLVAELLGDKERATAEYQRARRADDACEAPVRALGSLSAEGSQGRLLDLARNVDEAKGALLALEAAMRVGPEAGAEYEGHLRQALELAPHLPFASFLGERLARTRGDVDGVLEWLRSRREASTDPVEAAHDRCREAMLMVERESSVAASLMEQAAAARPEDAALRALYERFAAERPEDWVAWRVARAEQAEGAAKARLLLQAARELERAGRVDEAAKLAQQSLEAAQSELARQCLARCELAGAATSFLTDDLMSAARSEDVSERERREARERLAELDEIGRNEPASALLWHSAILEESPSHLPSLRRIEQAYIADGRDDDLEPIAVQLVKVLEGPEVDAHAVVASRVRLRGQSWTDLRDLADAAAAQPDPTLWSLRQSFAHARVAGDDEVIVRTARALSERSDRDNEGATLLVQAAEALARADQIEEASQLLQIAMEREPNFTHTHLVLVDVLEKSGEFARAAEELEALARKSAVDEHRVRLWYRAALLWLDKVEELPRARRAFEEASDIDIAYEDLFERLRKLYTDANDATELAALLERRLDAITDPQERIEMEVLRGKALADIGEVGGAKIALAGALDANPDHVPALEAFADVCVREEDWSGAEQSLIRLARLVPDTDRQTQIYRQLSHIYVEHLPDFERAELVLREVLKRKPDDAEAQAHLVDVFRETGDAEKAIELCSTLLEQAQTPEDKRARTIQLALIHEQVEGDVDKALAMLDRVYKQAPSAVASIKALAEFHQRQGNADALKILLERAAKDARRALRTGRFNRDLFSVLETVARIKKDDAGAEVARVAVAALEGDEGKTLPAAGAAACSVDLDDLIAPQLMSQSFRALLKRAGSMLDEAFPMDLQSLRAGPLPANLTDLGNAIKAVASNIGVHDLEIYVTPALGPTCVPVSSSPAQIVLGASLAASDDASVRDFLLMRAIKILQTRACVLSRTAPIDLLPTVAAFIKTLAPGFSPGSADPKRFADAFERLSKVKPASVDPDVAALAIEVGGALDNRASTVNVAVNGWGDRAALLAQGSLTTAIRAIAWAGGHPSGPPAKGRDRATWIGRNAEARDLIVFVASDEFGQVRERLGN